MSIPQLHQRPNSIQLHKGHVTAYDAELGTGTVRLDGQPTEYLFAISARGQKAGMWFWGGTVLPAVGQPVETEHRQGWTFDVKVIRPIEVPGTLERKG
jgi:hypothetical protein